MLEAGAKAAIQDPNYERERDISKKKGSSDGAGNDRKRSQLTWRRRVARVKTLLDRAETRLCLRVSGLDPEARRTSDELTASAELIARLLWAAAHAQLLVGDEQEALKMFKQCKDVLPPRIICIPHLRSLQLPPSSPHSPAHPKTRLL